MNRRVLLVAMGVAFVAWTAVVGLWVQSMVRP